MTRIALVAMGTPSSVAAERHAGPGLRANHLATALAEDGHDVLLVAATGGKSRLSAGVSTRPLSPRIELLEVGEDDFAGVRLGERLRGEGVEAVVGVTAYGSSLAARLGLGLPLWADVFGDLLAEAQAKAAVTQNDWPLVHFWGLFQPVLESADRFSAVSGAQADALIGQLGMAGRLSARTAGEELVHVIPCAARRAATLASSAPTGSEPQLRGRLVPEDAFVVLWSGGFNTWCDTDTALAGIESAMAEDGRIRLVTTGGGIPGHDEETYRRFAAAVSRSPFRERIHLLGWVDSRVLPAYYADADVGMIAERPLYERRLGAENRAVQWAAHGLAAVTSALSEAGREMVAEQAAFTFPAGDGVALGRLLVSLAGDGERVAAAGRSAELYAARRADVARTAGPLLEWAARPLRAGDAEAERVVRIGMISKPETMERVLEAYVDALGTGRLAYRGARWVARRALGRARRLFGPLLGRRR